MTAGKKDGEISLESAELVPQFLFAQSQAEEEIFHQEDLIRLFPYGLSLNVDGNRPFLLLKDDSQKLTLPVAINPLEAGVTLTQSAKQAPAASPHSFAAQLLLSLKIEAKQCVFVQVKGVHQYLRIYLSGHPYTNSLKVRADEAMSLCLYLGIPIYATREFISRSKVMAAEIQGMAQGLGQNPRILDRSGEYLM